MAAKKYLVGTHVDNEIVVQHPSVSRRHSFLITEDDVHFDLVDVSSANGTFVIRDGERVRIQREKVELGDRVAIGEFETTVGDLLAQAGVHSEIFVSYSREDRDRSHALATFLSDRGFRVWWDDHLQIARPFDEQLEEQIKHARVVIVLWSNHSVKSQWVRAEAGVALERGVLAPVFIDRVEPPLLFRQIQGHFITEWNSGKLDEQMNSLAEKLQIMMRKES
jgi:TIR domain/FHA domain